MEDNLGVKEENLEVVEDDLQAFLSSLEQILFLFYHPLCKCQCDAQ